MLTPGLVLTALVTLSLVGYPLAALFAIITGFENQDVSIALRVFVVGLGGGAILMSLAVRLNPKFDIALLGFIALYFVRLLHDAAFQVWDASDALLIFAVTVLAPLLGCMFIAPAWDDKMVAKWVAILGSAASVGTFGIIRIMGPEAEGAWEGRMSLSTLNPISFGILGSVTAIAAMTLLKNRWYWIAFGIGFAALILSASRGPLVAFALSMAAYLILRRRWRLLAFSGAVVTVYLLTGPIDDLIRSLHFDNLGYEASSRQRLVIQSYAIREALENPILGSAYTEIASGQYPHNILIETGMALGLGGLALFLYILGRSVFLASQAAVRQGLFLALMLINYLAAAQFSGSLYGVAGFWLALAVLNGSRALATPAPRRTASMPRGRKSSPHRPQQPS